MVLRTAAAAVVAGLLSTGLAVVGVATIGHADAATSSAAIASATTARHCGARLARLPSALRSDLRAARKLPAGSRGPSLRAIREKALDGRYGPQAQQWAEHRIRHQAMVVARLPRQVRHHLRAVRRLPADQRSAARRAIRAQALAGGYGAATQQRARARLAKVRAHREACRAQRAA